MNILRKFLKLLEKEKTLILPSGNELFYTRNGVGIKITPENKSKRLLSFAVRSQAKSNPSLKAKFPEFFPQNKQGLNHE